MELIDIRMRLRGARQIQAENAATASSFGRVGAAARTAATTAGGVGRRGLQQFGRGLEFVQSRAAKFREVGRNMTWGMTLPLLGVGYLSIKTAAEFERSMAQVAYAGKLGGESLEEMRTLAIDMGARTIFSANEAAQAMLNLVKAGIDPATIRAGALEATMSTAAAGGIDLAQAAVMIGAGMNTFNLKGRDAMQIADALAGGANKSSAELGDLGLALAQAGQAANAYGFNLQETVGVLAAFADQGIRGSDAGTSLKTFLMRLNPTTKKSQELMNELNMSFFDSEGRMKNLVGVARELRTGFRGMTQEERTAAMTTMFGTDAFRAANVLYRLGAAGVRDYTAATSKRGEAEAMAQAQMQGLPGALERLRGSLETAAMAAGVAMAPAIEVLAGLIGGLADAFTALPKPAQTVIATLAALAAVAGPLIWVAGSLASAWTAVSGVMAGTALAGGLGAVGAGLAAIAPWAAVGVGVGVAGYFAAKGIASLFEEEKKIPPLQRDLIETGARMNRMLRRERDVAHSVARSARQLHDSRDRSRRTARAVQMAERRLLTTRRRYGPDSRAAVRAELNLAQAKRKNADATRELRTMDRLHGLQLRLFRRVIRNTVAAEKDRIGALREQRANIFRIIRAHLNQGASARTLAEDQERLDRNTRQLDRANNALDKSLLKAAQNGGPKFAAWLRRTDGTVLQFGRAVLTTNGRIEVMPSRFESANRGLIPFRETIRNTTRDVRGLNSALTDMNGIIPSTTADLPIVPISPAGFSGGGGGSGGGGAGGGSGRGGDATPKPRYVAPTAPRVVPPSAVTPTIPMGSDNGRAGDTHITLKVGRETLAKVTAKGAQKSAASRD